MFVVSRRIERIMTYCSLDDNGSMGVWYLEIIGNENFDSRGNKLTLHTWYSI